MKKQSSGIYKIECLINNKVYIGKSIDTYNRWKQHKSDLNGNRHHNSYLQNAWNKYGEDNFTFKTIEVCEENAINKKEVYWIKKYKSLDRIYGFNLAEGGIGGDTTLGMSTEEKRRLKIKQSVSSRGTNSLLNELSVEKIKIALLSGVAQYELASKYNVSVSTISKIKRCDNWEWVRNDLNEQLLCIDDYRDKMINDTIVHYYSKNTELSMRQISLDLQVGYDRVRKLVGDKVKRSEAKRIEERENERIANKELFNLKLTSPPSHNKTGVIGVTLSTDTDGKYEVYIKTKNKRIYIGGYYDKENAIIARLEAENKHFGKFAPQKYLFEEYGIGEVSKIDYALEDTLRQERVHGNAKKVFCITTNEIFDSIMDAENKYIGGKSNITPCCKGKRNYCGKHPETGEPLKWMYYDDYIALQNKNIKEVA